MTPCNRCCVDLVFTGHDHHYERTLPQDGVVWIVRGAAAKLTPVDGADSTAHTESTLQFVLVRIDGSVIDQVTLEARSTR